LPTVRSSTNCPENGHDECFTRTCSCDGESSPIAPKRTEMKRRPRHLFPKIKQKRKVAFFSGCLMDTMFKPTNDATLKLLQYAGCEIVIPEAQNCCGALQGHSGERDES